MSKRAVLEVIALDVEDAVAAQAGGADRLELVTDMAADGLTPSPGTVAGIRAAVDIPLDCYIEGADDFGAPVRYYEVPEIVRVAAPVYLKMGLRNAPNIYPVGAHLAGTAEALGRERIRRAELILRLLAEQDEG
jgi:hypothetical protein